MNYEKKLKELKGIFEEYKKENDKKVAKQEIYEKQLKDDFECNSLDIAKKKLKIINKKLQNKEESIKVLLSKIEQEMIELGIINEEDN